MMRSSRCLAAIMLSVALSSCDRPSSDTPPTIALGQDVCDHCNMIISDERFATATIVQGPRGPEPLLFDDFNCQAQHESINNDLPILARWSHDHATGAWFRTESGSFLHGPGVRAPMGSKIAAFASRDAAQHAHASTPGQILTFEQAWELLAPNVPAEGGG